MSFTALSLLAFMVDLTCAVHKRPFFVMGHMANSMAELEEFMGQGANAIEADVTFAPNGTAMNFHHGRGCDCNRRCDKKTKLRPYLSYLKKAVAAGGPYEGKLLLFYADTKTKGVVDKYQAGVSLADNLMRYLWKDVPYKHMLNVIVGIFGAKDKDLLKGVLERLSKARKPLLYLDHLGFDISGYDKLETIARTYKELGIARHRWQSDGIKNCYVKLYPPFRMERVISRRRGKKSWRNYVDKSCFWTVDDPHTIRKFLRLEVDSIISNKPGNVLRVLREKEFVGKFRLATSHDSPWLRIP